MQSLTMKSWIPSSWKCRKRVRAPMSSFFRRRQARGLLERIPPSHLQLCLAPSMTTWGTRRRLATWLVCSSTRFPRTKSAPWIIKWKKLTLPHQEAMKTKQSKVAALLSLPGQITWSRAPNSSNTSTRSPSLTKNSQFEQTRAKRWHLSEILLKEQAR